MDPGAPLVRVLGLGNVLMADAPLGPWVIHRLEATYAFPPEVAVIDVGTPGLDLVPYVAGPCGIILVDTVHAKDAAPGTIRLYDRDALVKFGPKPRLSPHDPGVTEAILAVEMAGEPPEFVRLVGVVPGSVQTGVGLTPQVQDAVARAARAERGFRAAAVVGDAGDRAGPGPGARRGPRARPRVSAARLERLVVHLVALHSVAVGLGLIFLTRWGAAFGGWPAVSPLFFARQAGIFHFVVVAGYLLEYHRTGGVTFLLTTKAIAVAFLLAMTAVDGGPWLVPASAAGDAAMGAVVWVLHRRAVAARAPASRGSAARG